MNFGSPPDAALAAVDDEALLELVGRGDYDAFTELYGRFDRMGYRLALRVVVDPHLAEDAFVESMLAVFRTASTFDRRRASARTWILTIVHRRAVDLVRRENRHRTSELGEGTEPHGPTAEETAELRAERIRVQDVLARLPERERQLIELAYYGGYTQSELASSLGLSLGTVKSRMFAGLTHMRELLAASAGALTPAPAASEVVAAELDPYTAPEPLRRRVGPPPSLPTA